MVRAVKPGVPTGKPIGPQPSTAGHSGGTGSSEPVISARDVWLRIPIYSSETRSLKSVLLRSVTGGNLRRVGSGAEIEAVRGVTCTINHGERVALIGHNGAGKSTFLKLLSGIYQPTQGHLSTSVAVHPMIQKSFITSNELSGLQAAKAHYLLVNGTLHGFQQFLDDVINFSGLGDFIHLPVRSYSEGMGARLLFSLLTGSKHECLALDEGFGAGDSSFYEKAEQRMRVFVESAGTLILASHSDDLLRKFCKRGLVFDQGRLVCDSKLDEALSYYHGTHY
ncbi:ABC transporter ATP-binding protein [Synechococcus sp. J7-Johnson]|nr:ABC transporter ATP-binding protein [Synechococcus sp. J7-Johnson]